MPDDIQSRIIEHIGPILFRLVWWNYLDPSNRPEFSDNLFDAIVLAIQRTYEQDRGQPLPSGGNVAVKLMLQMLVQHDIGDFASLVEFGDETYENVVQKIITQRNDSKTYGLFAKQYDFFTTRIANLSGSLISAIKLINAEFIIWLKTHPDHSEKIHADAFEQLTGEILTSHGYEIKFTGRVKNKSADLIAIQKMEDGQLIKYLVECKRYRASRKVGIEILNGVVGASYRAKTSYAMLVTTSSFTANVEDARSELEDFDSIFTMGQRLHSGSPIMNLRTLGCGCRKAGKIRGHLIRHGS